MDPRVMELRIRQWIPVFEEQAKSGLRKDEWCILNGISRGSFFRWQKRVRMYLLEHSSVDQLQVTDAAQKAENDFFVELPATQISIPGTAALRSLHDDVMEGVDAPISIHYGAFSISINGDVDENQLSSVLRAIKHVD